MKTNPPSKRVSCFRSLIVTVSVVVFCALTLSSSPAEEAQSPVLKPDEPVIDIHTHLFNANYLPVKGIISRYSATVAGADAGMAAIAFIIEKILLQMTDESAFCGHGARRMDVSSADVNALTDGIRSKGEITTLAKLQNVDLTTDEFEALKLYTGEVMATKSDKRMKAGVIEQAIIKAFLDPMMEDARMERVVPGGKNSLRSLRAITSSEEDLAGILMNEEYPKVSLFVHHMMDMQRAYGNDKPHIRFEDQVCRMKALDDVVNASDPRSMLLHFVAYDPFRTEDALPFIIRSRAQGAIGVKFYPPSGYRAASNKIPKKPNIFRPTARKIWKEKYGRFGKDNPNGKLDGLVNDLFTYCETNRIPILTHCTPEGVQAGGGYGKNSDPFFWEAALIAHPNLVVCFGHAGGGEWWFGTNVASSTPLKIGTPTLKQGEPYGSKVIELCRRYPNVYCDVSHLEEILGHRGEAEFKNKLVSLISEDSPYDLRDKIMYGTDWYMLYKYRKSAEYLGQFQRLFEHETLKPWRRKFFAKNAATFLNLTSRTQIEHLSPETKTKIANLMTRIEAN